MVKKYLVFIFVVSFLTTLATGKIHQDTSRDGLTGYRPNGCIECHAEITTPVSLSNRYFEWQVSVHEEHGVGCEKCHGGDPAATDKAKAHEGVLSASKMQSRVNWQNLPETCRTCHERVVSAFVKSRHFEQLRPSRMGPSCNACHAHMGSNVMLSSSQTATLCAHCHDTINGLLPARPDIPAAAETTMQSINRAEVAVRWAEKLLKEAQIKKLYLPTQPLEVMAARASLKEAKTTWHTFNLEATKQKADEAFRLGMKVKDELSRRLNQL
jgi:predicted CXXCH cytochrome family protein